MMALYSSMEYTLTSGSAPHLLNLANQRREPQATQALMLEGLLPVPRTVISKPRFSTRFGSRCRDR